jgi:hypothetical protein
LAGQQVSLSAFISSSSLTSLTWTAFYANTADTFGSLASPTRTQIATGTFTISSALAQKTATFTIPSAATTGIEIVFTSGALLSGQTLVFTAAQLELGTVVTPFERRPVSTELALCQRYYWRSDDSQAYGSVMVGGVESATVATMSCVNPVTMRVAPTLSFGAGLSFFSSATSVRTFTINMQRSSKTHAGIEVSITGGGATLGQVAYLYNNPLANSFMQASAEL